MVYRYAIGGNEVAPYPLNDTSPHFRLRCRPYGTQDNLTEKAWDGLFSLGKACHQLYYETKLLPYKLNVFNISLGGHFSDFLLDLNDTKKKAITTVSFGFKYWAEDPMTFQFTVPKELKDCTGLRTAISIITLQEKQKKEVKDYAEERGLKLVIDHDVLDVIDADIDYLPIHYICKELMYRKDRYAEDDYSE